MDNNNHDLLITIDGNVKNLSEKVDVVSEKLEEHGEKIHSMDLTLARRKNTTASLEENISKLCDKVGYHDKELKKKVSKEECKEKKTEGRKWIGVWMTITALVVALVSSVFF